MPLSVCGARATPPKFFGNGQHRRLFHLDRRAFFPLVRAMPTAVEINYNGTNFPTNPSADAAAGTFPSRPLAAPVQPVIVTIWRSRVAYNGGINAGVRVRVFCARTQGWAPLPRDRSGQDTGEDTRSVRGLYARRTTGPLSGRGKRAVESRRNARANRSRFQVLPPPPPPPCPPMDLSARTRQ